LQINQGGSLELNLIKAVAIIIRKNRCAFSIVKKLRRPSEIKYDQGSGDCSAITVFDMGEFVILALAYSFAPLIFVFLLLLLLRAFFLRFLSSSLPLVTKEASLL
jgi:hypothetical protein